MTGALVGRVRQGQAGPFGELLLLKSERGAAITAYEDRHTTQPAEPTKPAERRATAALPADYEPVFTDLWEGGPRA